MSLLNRLVSHFPGGEVAFNAYTSCAVRALKHLGGFAAIAGGVVNPASTTRTNQNAGLLA